MQFFLSWEKEFEVSCEFETGLLDGDDVRI